MLSRHAVRAALRVAPLPLCVLLILLMCSAPRPLPAQSVGRVDVLLEQGLIYDGTGAEPVRGDVAIRDDRIVGVGRFATSEIGQRIDCRALIIAPGFIDLHNHSDRQVVARDTRAAVNYLLQGCTSIVTGNCGAGPTDVADYCAQIEAEGVGPNVLHLLPHGSLRDRVMGSANREATDEELDQMKRLVQQAMQDGAWGLSTGLIYVPGTYADTDELIELCRPVSEAGGLYVSHIRNEGTEVLSAVAEAIEIGRAAALPVHISHFKSSGQDAWGLVREAARQIERARQNGQTVTADQYPYTASSTSLTATVIPTWARAGGNEELLKRLDDPEIGPRLTREIADRLQKRDDGRVLRIARCEAHPQWTGLSIAQIAEQTQLSPLDVVLAITRDGGAAIVNFSMSEDDVRHVMQRPWVATASDGRANLPGPDRPHPRSYGTFPRKIGYYALRERVLSLANAIRSCSGLPAEILGLTDRGRVQVGHYADLAVFALDRLEDTATFDAPHRYARGMEYVFVNGALAVADGQYTGVLSGRAVRHIGARP